MLFYRAMISEKRTKLNVYNFAFWALWCKHRNNTVYHVPCTFKGHAAIILKVLLIYMLPKITEYIVYIIYSVMGWWSVAIFLRVYIYIHNTDSIMYFRYVWDDSNTVT